MSRMQNYLCIFILMMVCQQCSDHHHRDYTFCALFQQRLGTRPAGDAKLTSLYTAPSFVLTPQQRRAVQ